MAGKSPKLGPREIAAFRAQIWAFYGHSGRKMPWRGIKNPYKILVSEVMLQQTQVSRVLEKYPAFLKKFPTIQTLSEAPLSKVITEWQGLGYNRRAKYLWESAKIITSENGGVMQKSEEALERLPGIGPYTARAIVTFAYNKPCVFIETNIRRAFLHHFFVDSKKISDKEILPFIQAALDTSNPREWYYALMDYGSTLPKMIGSNSNTRSRHYARQSKFAGSLRKLRGIILRSLTSHIHTQSELSKLCGNDDRVNIAIKSLIDEGMIVKKTRTRYALP